MHNDQASAACGIKVLNFKTIINLFSPSKIQKDRRDKQVSWMQGLGHIYITYFMIDYSEDIFLYTFQ